MRGLLVSVAVLLSSPSASADTVLPFADGRPADEMEREEAVRRGLTVLDLSDVWTPWLFADDLPYRETLVLLSNELPGAGDVFRHGSEDRYHELFGIFPTLGVLRARLADAARHACHDAVDDAALLDVALPVDQDGRTPAARRADPLRRAAIAALQGHLVCDGLLDRVDGRYGGTTAAALGVYRRRHMLPDSGPLEAETCAAMLRDSRELDFRALLRALRERVVDATGLIEDGSAAGRWEQVLGRDLDAPELRDGGGWPPLPRAAPDLIAPATEAAARALGWTSPADALEAMARLPAWRRPLVAVALPPPPAHDRDVLSLRAEIDRGDVWPAFSARGRVPERRPSLVLFADTPDGPLALVRWPTTIGGWQREKTARGVVWRYKPSPVGEFVWRDLIVAPSWFPPPTTPDAELVRRGAGGRYVLREDTFGPGYRSAYGLVMLMHEREVRRRSGAIDYQDTAVRTHGSVSYGTIGSAGSHGCHRLYNHLAVRLAAFVLRHRENEVIGAVREPYLRRVEAGGQVLWIRRELRGYGYRLAEPVPVTVLPGIVHRGATMSHGRRLHDARRQDPVLAAGGPAAQGGVRARVGRGR